MNKAPEKITISLTATQAEQLEEIKKLTGLDSTSIFRAGLSEIHKKVIEDEEGRQIATLNAMLDVQ